MLVTLETHATKARAESARAVYIEAQRIVDRVIGKVLGRVVDPAAEEIYFIAEQGGQFAVVFEDPSLAPPAD